MPETLIAETIIAEWLQVVILAIVQGIAEFLPISSSGHLNVFQAAMGKVPETAELSIVLHFGTLLAILAFYWREILRLLSSDRRVIPMLIVGTIPVAVIGVIVKSEFEEYLASPLVAGFMFPITGLMLIILSRSSKGEKEYVNLTWKQVILIGLAQSLAVSPGISRSGSTITAGALLGLKRQSAATFSFLLAIPAILGAVVLEAKDVFESGKTETDAGLLALGTLIAFGVGYVSLKWLVDWLEKGRLHTFAYYLIPLGVIVVIWRLAVAS